jgi:regulator of CtrA degradation
MLTLPYYHQGWPAGVRAAAGKRAKGARETVAETGGPTAFFGKTYDEAFALLVEARNYVAYEQHGEGAAVNAFQRLVMICEAARLTTRLTHIMSWLLFQKAVHAGEIGRGREAIEQCRLGGHRVCLGGDDHEGGVPPRLNTLLERSRKLYVRVARLDELLARA